MASFRTRWTVRTSEKLDTGKSIHVVAVPASNAVENAQIFVGAPGINDHELRFKVSAAKAGFIPAPGSDVFVDITPVGG